MELLSGKNSLIVQIMDAAQELGREETQLLFGRRVYCDLFNRYPFPENVVYRLRPEKTRSFRERHFRDMSPPEKMESFGVLKNLLRNQVPELVATFRIVRNEEADGMVALMNNWGELSDQREAKYFNVRSKVSLRSRCLRLGDYHWVGPEHLVRPFLEYCMPVELLACPS